MKRFNISHVYDCDISCKGIYAANTETLSQICSFLNPVRYKVQRKLGIKSEFKLSGAYVLFWFLTDIADSVLNLTEKEKNAEKPLDLIELSMNRMFNFSDFSKIVNEHGLVPISAMPDAAHHHKADCVYIFENRLRLAVKLICEGNETTEKAKEDIYTLLCDGLGVPPESFDLTFIDSSDSLKTIESLSPEVFFKEYCETETKDYTTLLTSLKGAKEAVANQIKNGEQVVVLADTRHQASQMLGILDTDFIDTDDIFGRDFTVSKEEKINFGIIKPKAYLTLDGVAFDNEGQAVRFKAQDTHGSDTGADGHYTMSSRWFDEYALSAIVNKKYL